MSNSALNNLNKDELVALVEHLNTENAVLKAKMCASSEQQINFADYILSWLEQHRYEWQKTTYEGYSSIITKYIVPYFSQKNLSVQQLKPSDIEAYYSYLMCDLNLSAKTVLHHHANIRKCLKSAVKDELIKRNPAALVDLPHAVNTPVNYLSEDELQKLLFICRVEYFSNSSPIYPVVLLASLGLRRSETLGVKWCNIDLDDGILAIKNKIVPLKGQMVSEQEILKNQSSYRILKLPNGVIMELQHIRKYQFLKFGKYLEYVCSDNNGNVTNPCLASHQLLSLVKKYRLKPITIQGLRHTCATIISNNSFNLKYIQEWLGHSTIKITADTYTHVNISDKEKIAVALDDLFTP